MMPKGELFDEAMRAAKPSSEDEATFDKTHVLDIGGRPDGHMGHPPSRCCQSTAASYDQRRRMTERRRGMEDAPATWGFGQAS
jgi:hypothetical protein